MKKNLKKIIVKLHLLDLISILFYIFRIFPIKTNKILCTNFSGKGYGDNPKYIVEKLIASKNDFDIVWAVKNMNDDTFPDSVRKVKIYSLKYIYELVTSKIWINNSRFDVFVKKRKGQFYIQTWHGGLALKKIEYDAYEKLSDYYHQVMKNDNEMIDLMISNSNFCSKMFKNGFKYNGKILEIGSPRNDILVNADANFKKIIKKKLNIKSSEKCLLYAPTFRNSYDNNPYDIDFKKLKEQLEMNTNDKWKILVKLHPRIVDSSKFIENSTEIIDVTTYNDIQELILICDLLITDYSSTMFETMIASKDVILYANDIENYYNERGFYFNFNELPFPLVKDNDELINIINVKNKDKNSTKYELFKNKVGLKETGKSSEKIVEIILDRMKK